jgi:heptosyltransferase-2
MRDFLAYLLYRAGSAVITAFPLPAVFRAGEVLGLFGYYALPKYRRLALSNATIAFGREKSARELHGLVRHHFQLLTANLLSSVKMSAMPPEKIEERVDIQNLDAMAREFRAGVPVALVLTHLSNWELFAQLMPRCVPFIRSSSIYQKLRNRLIDAHVRRTRSRTGLELFDRAEGFQPVIDLLRSGGGVGILSDQHAGDNGVWTPFFGKLASTSPLAALLAKRTRAAIIAAAVYTVGPARWRMVFTERFDTPAGSIESLTAKANEVIEEQIRAAPEDWFWVHDRWKTPRPNFLLGQYKRGVYLPPPMIAEQLKPFRILVRTSNWLGDAVMSAPALRAIKRGRPDAHLTVFTPASLAPLWKLIDEVDEIIPMNGKSLFSTARSLRRHGRFDAAVLFPNSLRSALEVWLGGIPRRIGYRGHFRAWLLNQIVRERGKPKPPPHQSIRYLQIARELGADVDDESVGEAGDASSARIFHRDASSVPYRSPNPAPVNPAKQRLGLCPGAEYGPAKRWLPERFAEVAKSIAEQYKAEWVLLGTAKDKETGDQIAAALGNQCVNRVGQTTIDQLIEELATCRLLLTNDTGTMHLAALLGLPTIAIFGSTEPGLTGPLGNRNVILRHHVECSPCFLRECPIDFRCMKAVTVDEVIGAVSSLLDSGYASSARTPVRSLPDHGN